MNETHVPADARPTAKRSDHLARAKARANPGAVAALERAREEAGGNVKLAKLLHGLGIVITQQAICQWVVVPVMRVLDVEKITGVPKYELRPDLPEMFPPPRKARAAK